MTALEKNYSSVVTLIQVTSSSFFSNYRVLKDCSKVLNDFFHVYFSQSLMVLFCLHLFSCPPEHMIVENATGRQCVLTACAKRPCNYGTCISQSPTEFQCHCPDGYTGHNCEITLAVFHKDTGLTFSSMFAICICFLALLGSYGNYLLYYLW